MAFSALHFSDAIARLHRCLPDRFVRRSRKITPAQLIGVLCVMTGFGRIGYRRVVAELHNGLGRAFGWMESDAIPSPQAIGQARRSLTPAICDEAFAAVVSGCTNLADVPVASYAGMRLLGMDGTRLSLPPSPALIDHFGCPRNHLGSAPAPMAGLVQIWDVGRNCPVACELTTCDFDERGVAQQLFSHLGPNDLLIGDRGYPGFEVFRAICRRRARFLVRCPATPGTIYAAFLKSGLDEDVVLLTKRDNHQRPVKGLPSIPLRLVRVMLADGSTAVLATNLWRQRGHDRETLAKLYTQRWRIETAFREMKVFHALEQFSATYPDGIYQELIAIQIFLLLTGELEALVRRSQVPTPAAGMNTPTRPLVVQEIRFNRLLVADNVIHILRAAALGGRAEVRRILPGIIAYQWKNRSIHRPGRAYPRIRKRSLGRFRTPGA